MSIALSAFPGILAPIQGFVQWLSGGARPSPAVRPAAGFATNSIAFDAISTKAGGQNDLHKVFMKGFWTNVLNPKVALFFLAFLPQFISPAAEHKTITFLVLGLLFNFNGLWINFGYAALGAFISQRLAVMQRGMQWLERVAGVLFIGFGLKLALSDNPAQ